MVCNLCGIECDSFYSELAHFLQNYQPALNEILHGPRLPAEGIDLFMSF